MLRKLMTAAITIGYLGLGGCAGTGDATRIQGIVDDQFGTQVEIDGAFIWSNPLGGPTRQWYLSTFVDKKTRAVAQYLHFYDRHDPPASHFDFAADDIARELRVEKITSGRECRGRGCEEDDEILVDLDSDTLLSRIYSGYAVKVSARDGTAYVLEITPTMIQLQFAALDKVLASPAVAAAPPGT